MQLNDATDLERRVYEQCLAVEEMPASPEQTALVSTLSEAGHQLQTLRAENAELKRQAEALRDASTAWASSWLEMTLEHDAETLALVLEVNPELRERFTRVVLREAAKEVPSCE